MALLQLDVYRLAARFLADARIATLADDTEIRFQFDDSWERATYFVLRQAPWRFALLTATLVPSVAAIPGFTEGYAYPANWLRTHAIFLVDAGGRENPLDLREQGTDILTNSLVAPTMRYVSSVYSDPALAGHPWPEHFGELVAAYLAFLAADRIAGVGAAARMSELFASLLPEAIRIDAVPEDRWLPHQRDGSMFRAARDLLKRGFWRFAIKTVTVAPVVSTPLVGYSNVFGVPADWVQTHRLYVASTGREFPFDVREHSNSWSANRTAFTVRYTSSDAIATSLFWPEPFRDALLAFLEEGPGMSAEDGKGGGNFPLLLASALATEADPPDDWLRYQLDGSFLRASRAVLGRGYWWWALKQLQIDASMQLPSQPDYGFPYRYALPDDHFRTHALFVPWDGQECPINIRETAQDWSTDAGGPPPGGNPNPPGSLGAFVARYVSTSVLDATGGTDITKAWPELVAKAVLAYCDWQATPAAESKVKQQEFDRLLLEALGAHSRPEDDWLRFQLNGSFRQAVPMVLERGRWRFAVKTETLTESSDPLPSEGSDGTSSPSYSFRFIKPNDLLKTIWVYYVWGTAPYAWREDIPFRDEEGAFHAEKSPITVRYVSRRGLDSTTWPANFRRAVNACLLHLEKPDDLRLKEMYEDAERRAEGLDDANDMPPVHRPSRFTSARYGRGNYAREWGYGRW